MRTFLLIPIIVFLVFILAKRENYGTVDSKSQQPSIVGLGNDIDINVWLSGTYSGVSGGLGTRTNYDAQLAPSNHFILQIGDLNRLCWSDTTGKCAGFRKQLQPGGGGPVWYLYTSNGSFSMVSTTEHQKFPSPSLTAVAGFNIPKFLIVVKSAAAPQSGVCQWVKTSRYCSTSVTPSPCGSTGTWKDTYSVQNASSGNCQGSEGQVLVNGVNTDVAGAPCTTPACTGYDAGIPGTVVGGSPSPGYALTGTTIEDCKNSCNLRTGCKTFQFNTSPASCTGYNSKTGITTGTTSFVYTRVSPPVAVTDPSFEAYAPAIQANTGYGSTNFVTMTNVPAGLPWTTATAQFGQSGNSSWGGFLAADGSVYLILQTVASVQETVTVVPGSTYTVSWNQRGRPGGDLNDLNVSLNGTTIFNEINIASTGSWVSRTSSQWIAPAGVTSPILRFYSTNPLGGDRTVLIDNISMATEFSPVKYRNLAGAPCTNDIVSVRTACSSVAGCDTIGQQTNGCWHCLGPGGSADTTYYSNALLRL